MTRTADERLARKGRMVAIVIAVTMVSWLVLNGMGQHFDWPARYAFLFDMSAIAAFIWSLAVAWQIWRHRHHNQG